MQPDAARILRELATSMENAPKWYFTDPHEERAYIQALIVQQQTLADVRRSTQLQAVPARLTLASKSEVELFVLFTAGGSTAERSAFLPDSVDDGKMRNVSAFLTIRMINCDRTIYNLPTERELETSERLPIEGKVCRPVIDILQRNINFGVMQRNQVRERTIKLANLSDLPLFYRIVKTGNFVSGSMEFPRGLSGVVRAMGSVQVPFLFNPSMHGAFCETIKIENILAPSHSQVITVKAVIQQSKHFWVDSMELTCGNVLIGEGRSEPCRIMITNTSNRRRTFNIWAGPSVVPNGDAEPDLLFWQEHEGSAQDKTKTEEEIEHLEQKLTLTLSLTLRK